MAKDPLDFLDNPQNITQPVSSEDPLDFLDSSSIQSKLNPTTGQKILRKIAQPFIGAAEYATAPWNLANALEREGAYRSRQRVTESAKKDLERIHDKMARDEKITRTEKLLYDRTKKMAERRNKKAAAADVGTLLEKGTEKLTGINIEPETLDEHAVRILSSIRSPAKLAQTGKNLAEKAINIPKHFTKEGRKVLKLAKDEKAFNTLSKVAKGNPEKEGLLNFAKEKGLSPQATTLLMNTEGKTNILGKIAKKTKRYKETVNEIKNKLGQSYADLEKIGNEGGYLGSKQAIELSDNLRQLTTDLDRTLIKGPDTKAAINAIEEGILKLELEGATVGDLINTRINLGQSINWNNIDPKGAMLNQARETFFKAIEKANPEVAKNLKMTDKSWGKLLTHQKILEKAPKTVKIHGIELPVNLAIYGVGAKYLTGASIPTIGYSLAAKEVAQRMFTQFLINPKYQGLHKRIVKATLHGDKNQVTRLMTVAYQRMKKDDAELD